MPGRRLNRISWAEEARAMSWLYGKESGAHTATQFVSGIYTVSTLGVSTQDARHTFGSLANGGLSFVCLERKGRRYKRFEIFRRSAPCCVYISFLYLFSTKIELFRSKQKRLKKKLFWSEEEQKIKLMFPLLSG